MISSALLPCSAAPILLSRADPLDLAFPDQDCPAESDPDLLSADRDSCNRVLVAPGPEAESFAPLVVQLFASHRGAALLLGVRLSFPFPVWALSAAASLAPPADLPAHLAFPEAFSLLEFENAAVVPASRFVQIGSGQKADPCLIF